MSILSGVLKQRGDLVSATELRERSRTTERYATGPAVVRVRGRLGMCVQPYATHRRSAPEDGPRFDAAGTALSFDGRLDNFREIAHELGMNAASSSDADLTLAGFQRWGERSFARLTGDWALVLWSEREQTLYLVRDHAGTRTLFYRCGAKRVSWATYLENLVSGSQSARLSEVYLAAALSSQHLRELTPYEGVRSVPPGHTVIVRAGSITVRRHWFGFDRSELQYATEADYDAAFVDLFRQAVARRSDPGDSVIAELSGGMDSTSIVCVSDHLRTSERTHTDLLDTVSYYDDSEASLDERAYFSITEAKRGKEGTHVEMAYSQRTFLPHDAGNGPYLLPGADSFSMIREQKLEDLLWNRGYRAILSGIGGDELLGGVPDSNPELSGYLVSGQWASLMRQSIAWSLVNRVPLVQTLSGVVRYTTRSYFGGRRQHPVPPWLAMPLQEIATERAKALSQAIARRGREPRQIDNEETWWSIMESLPHNFPRLLKRPEYRYPYLDKELAEFLLRVPRAQLLKPGRRRLLMRRALRGIVPEEILERKRKAYQLHAPVSKLQQSRDYLRQLFSDSALVELGCIDAGSFLAAMERVLAGDMTFWFALLQAIAIELWLQSNSRKPTRRVSEALSTSAAPSAASEIRLDTQRSA